MLTRVRRVLALIAVAAALLAVAAMFKGETCGCAGTGLPFGTIALASGIVGALALASYVAAGFLGSRRRGTG